MKISSNILMIALLFAMQTNVACGFSQNKKNKMETKHSNRLANENSPYLLQHAHNPVDWYPWGTEALEKAKRENKIILISIGYAACHWCHVMERESFENEDIAHIMNSFFVCIKVDREERPDIDQIYMDAVQMMTGQGGWPLNCFAMPNGKPFWGGTYFRPNDWANILRGIQNAWLNEPDKVENVANQISEGIRSNELIVERAKESAFKMKVLENGFKKWKSEFDTVEGGNNRAPKFPLPNSLQYLLQYYYFSKDQEALDHVTLSLDKMAMGGIYDQVGGGFARYSVDAIWKVPHFEKMLYDNGQLVSLYAEAYQLTQIAEYKQVIEQTLEFMDRELSLPEGGFYSSLDADSEGVEGKFYVWEQSEIAELLGDDADLFCEYYGIAKEPNWEEGNILMVQKGKQDLAKQYGISVEQLEQVLSKGRELLLQKREERIRPGLDDKALTSWNAMMLKGYVDAYKALGDIKYLERAERNADFILKYLKGSDAQLDRNYKDGKSKINGFLDDYAFTIEAFVALYQANFNEKWLAMANELMTYAIDHFGDEESGMFFYTSDEDPDLIARKMELIDNVIPSSNSVMAKCLYLLGRYYGNDIYINRAKQMLFNVENRLEKLVAFHSNWGQLYAWFANATYEVVVVGENAVQEKRNIEKLFLPNVLIAGSEKDSNLPLLQNRYVDGQTTFYLCKDQTCKFPVTSVGELLGQLEDELRVPRKGR